MAESNENHDRFSAPFAFLGVLILLAVGFVELAAAHPIPRLVYAVVVASVGLPWMLLAVFPPSYPRLVGPILFMLALIVLHLVPWTSRKPFLADLHDIKPGMTMVQVNQIMQPYMVGPGRKWTTPAMIGDGRKITVFDLSTGRTVVLDADSAQTAHITGAVTFRHSDDGAFDSDWGVVHFQDGRVINVEFFPD